MHVTETRAEVWGSIEGQDILKYQLTNKNNLKVCITNFGATITEIITPDKNGILADIALGYDRLDDYVNDEFYVGSVVGRFANRIAGGKIELEGQEYQLAVKEGGFHHHGGKVGFNKKVWQSESIVNNDSPAVKLTYLSKDGEEGFPGNLLVTVIYTLTDQNQLVVDYTATTDRTTILNLTQHTYFNLGGHAHSDITGHFMTMPLEHYLPVNHQIVPGGNIAPVEGTPFDFRDGKTIGKDINELDEQLILGSGYDHSWVIKTKNSAELKVAARVLDPENGRTLVVYTTEPAVHLYTGNFLNIKTGKGGASYSKRSGFCLETQQFPDSPNKKHFPSTVLKAENIFKSKTVFEFGIIK